MKLIDYRSGLTILVFGFLLLLNFTVTAKEPVLETLVITNAEGKAINYQVEIARTPSQTQRGLMFRDTLAADRGMLFIYKPERPAAMWMKNTILSLDMLFIDSQGVIIKIAEKTTPFSLASIESGGSVRAVLELNAEQAELHKFVVGDKVSHPLFDETVEPQKE